jgi:hypothetical protein
VGGHSTGARVSLMVGSLVDAYIGPNIKPLYLKGTKEAEGLTNDMINILPKIKAIVADHPDPMMDPKQNPDVKNYKIDKTPVFIITGNQDTWIERPNGSWDDFE